MNIFFIPFVTLLKISSLFRTIKLSKPKVSKESNRNIESFSSICRKLHQCVPVLSSASVLPIINGYSAPLLLILLLMPLLILCKYPHKDFRDITSCIFNEILKFPSCNSQTFYRHIHFTKI